MFTGPLQALAIQSFPLHRARAGRRSAPLLTAPCSPPHTNSWLSRVQATEWPEGSAVSHLQLEGNVGTTGWMPPDTAPQACRRMNPATCCFCSFLGSHSTFSAEALARRHPGLSQPASCFTKDHLPPSHGKSTAGMGGKNVPIDMYIPQCCNFVRSNHVNTCMDFIIYILYINL